VTAASVIRLRVAASASAAAAVGLLVACSGVRATSATPAVLRTYIVQLQDAPLVSYAGGVAGLAPSRPSGTGTLDLASPASQAYLEYLRSRQAKVLRAISDALGRRVGPRSVYDYAMDGFAVDLTDSEAARVARLTGVASVRLDTPRHPVAPSTASPGREAHEGGHRGGIVT